ncbi:hypothetical protein CPB85DRAFT_1281242 [Mucidula mucida]|nr:hypothetical protein CPB85DRAFT_1281242 [Mucidula mucida]
MSECLADDQSFTLSAQESPTEEDVAEWESFTTPQTLARHLPSEMLQEIFLCLLSDDVLDVFNIEDGQGLLDAFAGAGELRQVGVPGFWARTLLVNLGKARLCRNPTEMLRDVLSRTGALDFGIILRDPIPGDPIPGDDSGPFGRLMTLLAKRSLQWSTLTLNRVSPDVLRVLLPASGRLPRLRQLDIRLSSVSDLSFEDCPLLRHVAFECPEPSNVSLPYSQLTSFSSYNTYAAVDSPIRALEILRVSPNLVVFETDPDQSYYVGSSPIPTSFIHENLSNLITCDMGLLQCLTLPNLESLAVMSTRHTPFPSRLLNALPAVVHLLERSNCHLSRLLLHDCQLMPQMIKRVLSLVPGLSELIIDFSTSVDNMTIMGMAAISAKMHTVNLLPLLECFVYRDSTPTVGALLFFNDDFMAMLLKRSRSDQYGLGSIHITLLASDIAVAVERIKGRLHSSSLEDLTEMRASGLDIDITLTNSDDLSYRL